MRFIKFSIALCVIDAACKSLWIDAMFAVFPKKIYDAPIEFTSHCLVSTINTKLIRLLNNFAGTALQYCVCMVPFSTASSGFS
jgi:hypothetical protein